MIHRDRHRHHGGDSQSPILDYGSLLARADGQDAALRHVDHRVELLYAEHAKVGNREAAALIFFGH